MSEGLLSARALLDPVAVSLALRYLKTRKRRFAAFITWVSVAGLSLGVLVLTVVVSVMNGFDAELKTRILGTVPHMLLSGKRVTDPDMQNITQQPGVVSAYDFFVGAGMVTRNGAVNPVTIYGIDPLGDDVMRHVADNMHYGQLSNLSGDGRAIILGAPLAGHLGLLPGDTLALIISRPGPTGIRPVIQRHTLVGTFEIGADLDYSLALTDLADYDPAELESSGMSGVRLTLSNPLLAAGVAEHLRQQHPQWDIRSWAENYGELFQAVRLEKVMMFLILLMVVAVAAFNIVSGQMMVVADKRSDIAILRTMGASTRTVLQAFLFQGVLISTTGIAVGLIAGVITAHWITEIVELMKQWFGFALLEGTYFMEVPSLVKTGDLWVIGALSWSLCLLSAWLPAHRAADLNPLEGLHG